MSLIHRQASTLHILRTTISNHEIKIKELTETLDSTNANGIQMTFERDQAIKEVEAQKQIVIQLEQKIESLNLNITQLQENIVNLQKESDLAATAAKEQLQKFMVVKDDFEGQTEVDMEKMILYDELEEEVKKLKEELETAK